MECVITGSAGIAASQFGRLHLVTNNSRFLILPGGERNLGSRVLSLCTRRLVRDWPARFGHEVLLAETFVDPDLFRGTVLPRRRQGWRHALSTVLALAAAATLCGMRGYKAISEWVDDLSPRVLQRFRVRRRDGQYRPPSLSAMRSLLIRVNPAQLDAALRTWHEAHGGGGALAIDGKTIRGAIDGNQTHVLGIVGRGSKLFEVKQSWSPRFWATP